MGRARMATGVAALFQGRFHDALPILDDAARILRERCADVTWELDGTEHWARLGLIQAGRLRELSVRATTQLADAMARGDQFAETWIRAAATPKERLAADDPAGARASIARALAPWKPGSFLVVHYLALWHEVLTDLYEGDGARARARLAESWPALERSLLLRVQVCRVNLVYLRGSAALVAHSRDGRAAHLVAAERDARALAAERMPYTEAMADALRAGVAAARGERPAATPRLRAAIARFDAIGMALHAASARHGLAALTPDAAEASLAREASAAYFTAEGVARPERWSMAHAPCELRAP